MRIWLTASEIAKLALPGYPTTKRGVLDRAERENWYGRPELVRPAPRRGGAVEFYRLLLTPEAQACLSAKIVAQAAGSVAMKARAAQEPEAVSLTPAAEENRDARLFLLAAIDDHRRIGRLSATTADNSFVLAYNLGKVAVDGWIRQAVPELSFRTVSRWRATAKAGTLHRLGVDPGARRRGKGALEQPEVRTRLLALMVAQPHLSSKNLLKNLRDHFPDLDVAERTVRLARAALKDSEKVMLAKLTNPEAFNNKYRVSGTQSHRVTRLNELVMIDASPVDVLTKDGRQAVYVAVELYSRRLILHVTPTPRAAAVGELMRRTILAWGCPERLKTDNGSDFVAKASKRLFAHLGIDVDTSTPFAPWEKGQVERAIRTFQHDCGPLLPGFCGHNVAERKVIEARRAFAQRIGDTDEHAFSVELTAAELQRYADRWAAEVYAHAPNDGIGGVTPFAAAAGYIGAARTVEPRALDVLLQPIAGRDGIRTVHKSGVQVDGSHYHCPSLIAEKVLVRMDRADMGRALLFTPDGEQFLGEALCYEILGVNPAEAIAAARKEQNRIIAERSAEVRAEVKKIKPRDMIEAVLRQAAKDSGVLVELPRPTTAHTTPAIEAAAEAARGAEAAPALAPVPRTSAPADDFAEAPNVTRLRTVETPQQRFRRALALEAAVAAGEPVTVEDAMWLGAYQAGPECRGMRSAYEDFGEQALL